MKVLMVTALEVEWRAVVAHLAQITEKKGPEGTIYTVGRFEDGLGWDVFVVEAGPGNARSAAETTRGCNTFRPDIVVFVGVAGSLKADVKLGHVVVGSLVLSYEGGKDEATFLPRAWF